MINSFFYSKTTAHEQSRCFYFLLVFACEKNRLRCNCPCQSPRQQNVLLLSCACIDTKPVDFLASAQWKTMPLHNKNLFNTCSSMHASTLPPSPPSPYPSPSPWVPLSSRPLLQHHYSLAGPKFSPPPSPNFLPGPPHSLPHIHPQTFLTGGIPP